MQQIIKASQRLNALRTIASSDGDLELGGGVMEEAAFDGSRGNVLRGLLAYLNHQTPLDYMPKGGRLCQCVDDLELSRQISQATINVLNSRGWKLRVLPGVTDRESFSITGDHGLIYQCLRPMTHYIFFTKR